MIGGTKIYECDCRLSGCILYGCKKDRDHQFLHAYHEARMRDSDTPRDLVAAMRKWNATFPLADSRARVNS